MTCIDGKHVHANGTLRASKVYTGGPAGVDGRPWLLIADCAKEIAVLQDEKGVNFGGGAFSSTKVMESLGKSLCDAEHPKQDGNLKQF